MTFVFSNPKHHVDLMVPVASELARRGIACKFVSLAELRGFETPDLTSRLASVPMSRVIPRRIRKNPAAGAGVGDGSRTLARTAAWFGALGPRLRWLLRGSEVVVVPNDAAYPYDRLTTALRDAHTPCVLVQEGIRFPLPTEAKEGRAYGASGAAVCAWGEASASHFRSIGAAESAVSVTGNPRFDDVEPPAWAARGRTLLQRLELDREPVLYLSNTIDDMGFCTTAQKMDMFETFLREAAPIVNAERRAVVVKVHPREDLAAFRAVAQRVPEVATRVLVDEPLFAVLAAGRAAIVLASTVGLEALAFGLPLGVLAIPGHGHVFEYVEAGVATGLVPGEIGAGVAKLMSARPDEKRTSAFLERHMAFRGQAASRIADRILEVQSRTNRGRA